MRPCAREKNGRARVRRRSRSRWERATNRESPPRRPVSSRKKPRACRSFRFVAARDQPAVVQTVPVPPQDQRQHPGDGCVLVGERQAFRENLFELRHPATRGPGNEKRRPEGGEPPPNPLAVGVGRRRGAGRAVPEEPPDQPGLPVAGVGPIDARGADGLGQRESLRAHRLHLPMSGGEAHPGPAGQLADAARDPLDPQQPQEVAASPARDEIGEEHERRLSHFAINPEAATPPGRDGRGYVQCPAWLRRMIRSIFRLMKAKRTSCQGRNVRRKSVKPWVSWRRTARSGGGGGRLGVSGGHGHSGMRLQPGRSCAL